MRIILILLSLVILSGCAALTKKVTHVYMKEDTHYLASQSEPPLIVPGDLSNARVQTLYPIPGESIAPPVGMPSLAPPGSPSQAVIQQTVAAVTPAVRGRLSTDARGNPLLVMSGSYKTVWRNVGSALAKSGYADIKPQSDINAYFLALDKSAREPYQVSVQKQGKVTVIMLLDLQNRPVKVVVARKVLDQLAAKLVG